jgi:hypothetical protein
LADNVKSRISNLCTFIRSPHASFFFYQRVTLAFAPTNPPARSTAKIPNKSLGVTTEAGQKDDPLTSYRDKEPMTPSKIEEHEPTAVKREMTERIAEPGQTGTNSAEAAEIARKKGMAKGTAGAAETGSEYE